MFRELGRRSIILTIFLVAGLVGCSEDANKADKDGSVPDSKVATVDSAADTAIPDSKVATVDSAADTAIPDSKVANADSAADSKAVVPDAGTAQSFSDSFNSWDSTKWEGQKWCQNVSQGAWTPTVSGGIADMKTSDLCWGQIRTKQLWTPGTTVQIDMVPYLQSGGVNGDEAYIAFGSPWTGYPSGSDAAGVMFDNGKMYAWSKTQNKKTTIGSYTTGKKIRVTLSWSTGGTMTISGDLGSATFADTVLQKSSLYLVIANKDSSDGIALDQVVIGKSCSNPLLNDGFSSWSSSSWEGQKWCQNVSQGAWTPTVSGGIADMKTSDLCWGQIRTKQLWTPGTTVQIDMVPYLQSGGVNGDEAYIAFGSPWTGYPSGSDAAGVMFDNGKMYAWSKTQNKKTTIGSYTTGKKIRVTLSWSTGGTMTISGDLGSATFADTVLQKSSLYLVIANKDSSDGIALDQVLICK